MTKYRYLTCDVFTKTRFGGNQLAVILDASGLTSGQMQQIAREFNYSETTFVWPSEPKYERHVRIFTPTVEVPFAGHPNIGTAFVLAGQGEFGDIREELDVILKQEAGLVSVRIRPDADGFIFCELAAPCDLSIGETVDAAFIGSVLSLPADEIETATHAPVVAGVGLPFLIAEVASVESLRRARISMADLERLRDDGIAPDVHVYTHSRDEFDIRARMFAPFDGVPEDPATGSANCALAALLAHYDTGNSVEHAWRIGQGMEIGRPSVLLARTRREGEQIKSWIGGYSVLVSEGCIQAD